MTTRKTLTRVAAPLAFLLAATLGVVAVRSALEGTNSAGATRSPATAAATTAEPAATAPRAGATTETEPEFYVVAAGDTLEAIASAHATTVEQLLLLNPNVDPVALTIGQRIRVR